MASDEQWLADLRLPIHWNELHAALQAPGLKQMRRVEGVIYSWGSGAEREVDGVDRRQQLQQVTFRPPFDPTVAVAGFHLGGSRTAALTLVEALGLSGADDLAAAERARHAGESERSQAVSCYGQTADGHDLHVRIGDEVVEVAVAVRGFRLYQKQRSALWTEQAVAAEARRARADAWRSITEDDDRMLDDWAAHCRPWSDSSESEFVKFARWLKRVGPDERHAAALWCNWDYGLAPLFWIVRRPDCDLATAVHVLFLCEPYGFLGKLMKDGRLPATAAYDELSLLVEVRDRIERGGYTRAAIAYDAAGDVATLDKMRPTVAQREAVLPRGFVAIHAGRQIDDRNGYGGIRHPGFAIN